MSGRSRRRPVWVGHLRRLILCTGLVAATVVIAKPQAQAEPAAATAGLRPSLSVAQRDGRDLGSVPAQTQVSAVVTLLSRDPAGLAALADGNPHLAAARYAAAFGADPSAVARARAALAAARHPYAAATVAFGVQLALGTAGYYIRTLLALVAVTALAALALLLYLRLVIHHALLEEAAEHVVGPTTVCPECHRLLPSMRFCPVCGVSRSAAPRPLRRREPGVERT